MDVVGTGIFIGLVSYTLEYVSYQCLHCASYLLQIQPNQYIVIKVI